MTEDELLEQIRKTDPDAHIQELEDGTRVLVTKSLQSNVTLYVNPANLHIIHMDPLDMTIEPGDDPVHFKMMSYDEIKKHYDLPEGMPDGFD